MSGAISFLHLHLHGVDRESLIYILFIFASLNFTKSMQRSETLPSIDGRRDTLTKYGKTEQIFIGLKGDMNVIFT